MRRSIADLRFHNRMHLTGAEGCARFRRQVKLALADGWRSAAERRADGSGLAAR
ncbi:MAG TPA: hypothetical protein VLH79_15175 [Chthonomonadales bacterium]|nr:hypothetical protein [Chthonomonadales bacterium]